MSTLPVRLNPYRHRQRPARDAQRPIPIPTPDSAMRSLARATVASGLGALTRSLLPSEHAARTWPEDACVPLLLRAVSDLAMVANTPALTVVAEAFLAALVPQSAGADLLRRGLSLQFDGAASISVPSIALPAADFVGEGQAIPTTEAPTADTRLERYKLAVIAS